MILGVRGKLGVRIALRFLGEGGGGGMQILREWRNSSRLQGFIGETSLRLCF